MAKNKIEMRSYTFDVATEKRDDSNGNWLTGRPIVYGQVTNIGPFDEVIEPGALDGADLRDVPLLANHNDSMIPVARSRRNNGNSTMTLRVVPEGMDFEANLDTENNATARELNSAVERGDISGMSFRFRIAEDRWEGLDTDHPLRHIIKFEKIVEISAVTWPAYDSTEIYARQQDALDSARRELDNAREKRAAELDSDRKYQLALAKAKIEILAK